MMDLKERVKQLMTEVVCQLCTKEIPHQYQIQIEGTICISSDTEPPFAIQIAQLLSKSESEQVRVPRSFDGGGPSYSGPSDQLSPGGGTGGVGGGGGDYVDNRLSNKVRNSSVEAPSYGIQGNYGKRSDGSTPPIVTSSGLGDGALLTSQPIVLGALSVNVPDARDAVDSNLSPEGQSDSISPQLEIHSTKRDSGERAPLPQKKRRRYSMTQHNDSTNATPQVTPLATPTQTPNLTPTQTPSMTPAPTPTPNDDKEKYESISTEYLVSLPRKKREAARKFLEDTSPDSLDLGSGSGDSEQFTVNDMVRNLIYAREKGGEKSQIMNDLTKSLSAGAVKLVIPSVGLSPPDTPLPTPNAYDDQVFDLETPNESLSHASPSHHNPSVKITPPQGSSSSEEQHRSFDYPDSVKDLTNLQPHFSFDSGLQLLAGASVRIQRPIGLAPGQLSPNGFRPNVNGQPSPGILTVPGVPLPVQTLENQRAARPNVLPLPQARTRKISSCMSLEPMSPLYQPNNAYHIMPIPKTSCESDIKSEPGDYDSKSLLSNLGHMSKEAINGLIIVDEQSQKQISPQDYIYKDEVTGESLLKACNWCGKHFKYVSKLMEHVRSHTKTKPYKCSICSRSYTYKGDLTVHIRQHSLNKPYRCDCGRAFASKKYLSVHQSQARIKGRHAVSKDDRMGPLFECTRCGKRFKFFSSFDLHLQTHSLQTPTGHDGERKVELYECQACKCSFQDHVMFVEHVLEHEHGKFEPAEAEASGGSTSSSLLHRRTDSTDLRESKNSQKPRCLSLSSITPDEERKRRLSGQNSPMKTAPHNADIGFFRGPNELAYGNPPSSNQNQPLTPIVLTPGSGSYIPVNQFSTSAQVSMYSTGVALTSNPQMLVPMSTLPMSVPLSSNQAGGILVDSRREPKLYAHIPAPRSAGPFSPRIQGEAFSLPSPLPPGIGPLSPRVAVPFVRMSLESSAGAFTPAPLDGKIVHPTPM